MRHEASIIPRVARYLVLAMAMVFATGTVSADSRSDARAHYQAGVKFYSGGDYQSAIREFSAAQQLAPADLNNYNLALCYDKLGDPEPAIQYYRAFLDKQPNTDKRAEIEASINRLEAAAKSVAAKKAEEARRAEEMRRAEEARRAEEMRRAEDARRAEEARRAEDARRPVGPIGPPPAPAPDTGRLEGSGSIGGSVSVGVGGAASGGGTGIPGSAMPAPTGDAQLDRVQQIDVGAVRDQRMGGAGGAGGMADPRVAGGAPPPRVGVAEPPPPQGMPATPDDKPKAKPVYKKWWFWAVVGVSAFVVINILTEDSAEPRARELPLGPVAPRQESGGLTLMRW
jgi:hypothetical protein